MSSGQHDGGGAAPLLGLVLAGGRSTRMRTDKAALRYGGRSQLERAMELIAAHVERAYVSVRADQSEEPLRAGFPQIRDTRENLGPIAGLLAVCHLGACERRTAARLRSGRPAVSTPFPDRRGYAADRGAEARSARQHQYSRRV